MDNESPKRKKGALFVEMFVLLIFPFVCYVIVRAVIMKYQTFSNELNEATARAFGFGMGTLFHISCFIAGAFKNSVAIVLKRMSDFKDNLSLSFGFALKCYLEDMRDDGIAFLVEMICVISCLWVSIDGLLTAIQFL